MQRRGCRTYPQLPLSCHKPPKLGRLEEVPHSKTPSGGGCTAALNGGDPQLRKRFGLTSPCCTTPLHPTPARGHGTGSPDETPPTNQPATPGGAHRLGPARRPWGIAPGMLDRPRRGTSRHITLNSRPPGQAPFLEPTRHRAPSPPSGALHPGVPSSPLPRCTYTPTHPPNPPRAASTTTARVARGTNPGLG